MSYAIVFAGGGGKGSYQIGVLKALKDLGFLNKFIAACGTSVGALNAALFAQDNLYVAENVWKNISNEKILPIELDLDFNSIASKEGLRRIIDVNLNYQKIQQSRVNVYIMCTEVKEYGSFLKDEYIGRIIKITDLSKDEMIEYLVASASLPFIYGKTNVGGKTYLDGGLIDENNVPYKAMLELGYKKIFVIDLNEGVTYCKKINDANVFFLRPSVNLGNLFDGTIDFDSNNTIARIKLGYNDVMKNLNSINLFFEKNNSNNYIKGYNKKNIQDRIKKMLY